ncbi:hypothetical protein Hanom_Chr12g01154031 [Helianthus anomalus]
MLPVLFFKYTQPTYLAFRLSYAFFICFCVKSKPNFSLRTFPNLFHESLCKLKPFLPTVCISSMQVSNRHFRWSFDHCCFSPISTNHVNQNIS